VALVHQVLSAADIDLVLDFAQKRLIEQISDETTRTFASWEAKWRKEALEHYLKVGWSFIARDEATKAVKGFYLGQPFLFFRGMTQSLWIEYLDAVDDETAKTLIEIAVKIGREKHLQRVMFAEPDKWKHLLEVWKPESLDGNSIAIVKTTKG